jgi:S-adenosylmethionine hydrolase
MFATAAYRLASAVPYWPNWDAVIVAYAPPAAKSPGPS